MSALGRPGIGKVEIILVPFPSRVAFFQKQMAIQPFAQAHELTANRLDEARAILFQFVPIKEQQSQLYRQQTCLATGPHQSNVTCIQDHREPGYQYTDE